MEGNKGFPTATIETLKNLNLFVYTLEVLALITLISMDQVRFTAFIKRVFCGHSFGLISHL